jgi:large subunit GTPase 1
MVLAKSTKSVGLGNSLMNDRFGKGKGGDRKKGAGVKRINHATGEEYITNDREEASWVKMRSVTEQGALDEFLSTAELAGTDFTAEKANNTKIIHIDQKNPYLLSASEERNLRNKQKQHRARLTVPRRPKWDASTTREELDRLEKESFMDWRRGLAELQESNDLLMTPFERNLEVWRQLWRVIERSDVIVQIVDARNPLMFRSEDLEHYVKDVDSAKKNLLLINKADMMTYKQRKAWANYLKGANIPYKFFSASLAKEEIEARDAEDEAAQTTGGVGPSKPAPSKESESDEDSEESEDEDESTDGEEEDTRILSVDELERIFLSYSPKDPSKSIANSIKLPQGTNTNAEDAGRKLQVGLVGYPNVGKSSTINALLGAKKVSVSSTPGKTKHFQTLHLSEKVILCDCPGLVFPNFATTKADLVCNGVLPIDQLREITGPVTLVTQRIPQPFLEATYGINIRTRALEEGGTGIPTGPELLTAYARHRGFMTTGQGQPDQSRAARYVLKDYVNGKLLYCEPPPGGEDATEFNRELYDLAHLPEKRRQALLEALSLEDDDDGVSLATEVQALPAGPKTVALDKGFFKAGGTGTGHMSRPFNYKYSEQGKAASDEGRQLSGRKLRAMIAMEKGIDPKDVQLMGGKKHFKGGPTGRVKGKKQRNQVTGDNPE